MSSSTECSPSAFWPVRRVLVGHGIHAGEPHMKELYTFLTSQEKRPGIDHRIISHEEWERDRRLVDGIENIGMIAPDCFGSRGQRVLASYCVNAITYNLAIQPHGTHIRNSDAAIYGIGSPPIVKEVASYLGLSRALLRTEGLEALYPNSLGIEIGPDSEALSPQAFYDKIAALPTLRQPPLQAPIEEYIFVGEVTTPTAIALDLQARYEPFEVLTPHDNAALNSLIGAHAVQLLAYGWDGPLYDNTVGYRGELLVRFPLETAYDPSIEGHKTL